ncbi:hypothetical protein HPE56_04010 [Maribacter sp. ANRC-HE7]|uniref:DUF4136 domain-containing protein n=1 Tax=Maribacter aquimaris TaxID=2737171 RepID=A0ABR7UY37_9FLAO|nr:hypothetical protein [Maribacter aquimaris]MBD0776950.1 hypothetical protein [Maribacter aquimaris]
MTRYTKTLFIVLLVFLAMGCQSKFKYNVEKSEHAVTIQQDSLMVKIDIVDEAIIHVRKAIQGGPESTIPDYVTVLDPQNVALAYSYPREYVDAVPSGTNKGEEGTSKPLDLSFTILKPGAAFKIEIMDKDHGNIHNFWEAMGKPEPPTREQIKVMKDYANTIKTEFL